MATARETHGGSEDDSESSCLRNLEERGEQLVRGREARSVERKKCGEEAGDRVEERGDERGVEERGDEREDVAEIREDDRESHGMRTGDERGRSPSPQAEAEEGRGAIGGGTRTRVRSRSQSEEGVHGASMEDLKSYLTCHICLELFTRPKILPCVHSFCLQCLRGYLKTCSNNSASGISRKKKGGGFPCPVCRQHVPVAKPSKPPETWPDQLKDNFIMSSMLETVNQLQLKQHPSPASSNDITTPSRTSTTLPHCGRGQLSAAKESHCYCSTVKDEAGSRGVPCRAVAECVCWNCAAFVCQSCAVSAHGDCSEVQVISEAGSERRQEMLDWLTRVNELTASVEERRVTANTRLLSLQATLRATVADIDEAAREAIEVVHQEEQRLKQKVDQEFSSVLRHQRNQQAERAALLKDLRSLKESVEQCVLEKDVALLQQAQPLKLQYDTLLTSDAEPTAKDHEAEEKRDLNPGTFVPASLSKLRAMVLVGEFRHGTAEATVSPPASPVTSAPSSPGASSPSPSPSSVTSDSTSWFHLTEGPVLRHESRRRTLPPTFVHRRHPPPTSDDSTDSGSRPDDLPCSLTSPMLTSGLRGVTCHHASAISTRVKGDKAEPLIRDMVVLSNGWLVATDTANRCLKCFYKTAEAPKHHCKRLTLTQPPCGVCSVEGPLVAVTVPKERQLQLVMARPHLVPVSTFTLPLLPSDQSQQHHSAGWAVASVGSQRFAITTCPQGQPGSVRIVQMSGDELQCVSYFPSPVTTPVYIAATRQTQPHLVTSDPTSCDVACLTSDTGNAVFKFRTKGKVMGVTCHSELILLVDQSPALYILNNEGRCLHTLTFPKGKAGCSRPRAVAMATDSSLYVSDDHDGKIHLFHLGWRESPASS